MPAARPPRLSTASPALGGILRLHDLIFDFQPAEAEAVLGAWLDDPADDPARGYTHDDFAQHLRTEFSTFR